MEISTILTHRTDWFWKSDVCWDFGSSQFTLELCDDSWHTLKISDFPGNEIYRQNSNWRVRLLQIMHMGMDLIEKDKAAILLECYLLLGLMELAGCPGLEKNSCLLLYWVKEPDICPQ